MNDLRTAAQQALEFIRAMNSHGWLLADYESDMERTVSGLEAALAQEQATGSWHDGVLEGQLRERERWLAQEQAEPMQQPVAWMYTGIKQDDTTHGPHLVWRPEYMDVMSASKGAKATPLYTAPPQRPPLTDEEIRGTEQERAAMQQALEALEAVDGTITALLGNLLGSPDTDAPGAKVRAAITALRAALAQEQAEPVQEPAANRGSAEAVRIAIALEEGNFLLSRDRNATAAELRRLSAVEAQRDALLEALRLMMDCAGDIATAPDSMLEMALDDDEEETRRQANAFLVARAAIAKAEGNT